MTPDLKGTTTNGYISAIASALEVFYNEVLYRGPRYTQFRKRMAPRKGVLATRIPAPVSKKHVRLIVGDASLPYAVRIATVIAFAGLLRVSEYTVPDCDDDYHPDYCLLREDVAFDIRTRTATARIKKSKSDPLGVGPDMHWSAVPSAGNYCPVRLLREYVAWFDACGFDPRSPLFRFPDGRHVKRDDISKAIKKHARAAGVDPKSVASHGLRYGGAFELRDNGADWEEILLVGRWSLNSGPRMAVHYAKVSVRRSRTVANRLSLASGRSAVPLRTRH